MEPLDERQTGDRVAKPRVLVCDDSATIRSVIGHLLGPSYECLVVASGEAALGAAPAFAPDLIISDVLMEGMDGYEVCRRIRADPSLSLVPVILLTSKTDEESRVEALELGADDYLFKPIRPRELLARAASLVRLRRANLALAERSRELERANRTLREAQAALVQAEKLAAVGTMVAGLAHEINNPLSFIKAGAAAIHSLLDEAERAVRGPLADQPAARAEHLGALEEIREVAGELSEGALRLHNIVASLQVFATDRSEEFQEIDLPQEIDRAWNLAALKVPGNVRLEKEVGKLPPIRTVPHLFAQVLAHVLVNAREANRGEGTIRLFAGRTCDEAVVVVQDEGPGIPREHLGRIFDPFFTTKAPGQGVGLGLTVSYGIMRNLGGRVEAASPEGGGAVLTVTLPLTPPECPGGPSYNQLRSGGRPEGL
jgi:two-component system NtrC family sensor kinase